MLERVKNALNRFRARLFTDQFKIPLLSWWKMSEPDAKKPKLGGKKKKKVALLCAYSGSGYYGVQIQPSHLPTIEADLLKALNKSELIVPTEPANISQLKFQRTSRTDKGVSAAGQIFSLQLFERADIVKALNEHLPDQVRILGCKRVTKGFDSKKQCTGRAYEYLLPTLAFAPVEEPVTEAYRLPENIWKEVNRVLSLFLGTKNFFNFTSGREAGEASCTRYITKFELEKVFVNGDLEFGLIRIEGQSFMLHQIRKMIGSTIAIVKGYADDRCLFNAFGSDRVFFEAYNLRYKDTHEPMVWPELENEIQEFKDKCIYQNIMETEKKEKPMLNWLGTLHIHSFTITDCVRSRPPRPEEESKGNVTEDVSDQADSAQSEEPKDENLAGKPEDKPASPSVDTPAGTTEDRTEGAACDPKYADSTGGTLKEGVVDPKDADDTGEDTRSEDEKAEVKL